ncbi:GNAT family N-acetyltransferase [Vibrio profundum]|uniref:GNAT family N-acetyltransferase n=1 Tax=Vibrio profundum TaxID=2910247 RepID=UPI003D0CAEE1
MNRVNITQPAPPSEDQLEQLKCGLGGYNRIHTGELFREKTSTFIETEDGKILGGLRAEIKWGWLYVDALWISEEIRGGGWGSRLLKQMEDYALSKDVTNFHLETTTFQALDFYRKQGYSVFGELPDMPPGHTSYFLKKQVK